MGVNVRDVQAADLSAIHHLMEQLGYAPDEGELARRLEQVLAMSGHRVMAAEENGQVVGVIHFFERPALEKGGEVLVQSLVVNDQWRGQGIGEALMREAESWAESRNISSMALYTRVDRDKARAFYERIGYRLKATSHLLGRP
jgi:ribosomal protein S18 acetylase RimI-like enzyme